MIGQRVLVAGALLLVATVSLGADQAESKGATAAMSAAAKAYAIVTDLEGSAGPVVSLRRLLGDGLTVLAPSALTAEALAGAKDGLVVLLRNTDAADDIREPVEKYAADGHTVVADLACYAAFRGAAVKAVETPSIRVVAVSDITAGLRKDDTVPFCGKGKLGVLTGLKTDKDLTVLGVAQSGGEPAVVEEKIGKGRVIALDLQTPGEPYIWDAGSVYKYLFLANAIGNPVRFGELYPRKPSYDEVVGLMRGLAKEHPTFHLQEEGNAVGDYKIYSLSAGKPDRPGLLITSVVHGNEWENCLGLIRFARYLAEEPNQTALDLSRYRITLVPVMNPSGYEMNTRQNARKVDLNRNGDLDWETIRGEETAQTGKYGPGAYDWKGDAPLSEPEAQTYRRICESGRFFAFLDVHGNVSGTGYNKSLSYMTVCRPDCKEKAGQVRDLFNASVAGRFVLRQEREKECKPLVIESVEKEAGRGLLVACSFASRDKYGFLVELPAGVYVGDAERSGYGTLISTDLAAEVCLAFVRSLTR
jgi:hypothetical protein